MIDIIYGIRQRQQAKICRAGNIDADQGQNCNNGSPSCLFSRPPAAGLAFLIQIFGNLNHRSGSSLWLTFFLLRLWFRRFFFLRFRFFVFHILFRFMHSGSDFHNHFFLAGCLRFRFVSRPLRKNRIIFRILFQQGMQFICRMNGIHILLWLCRLRLFRFFLRFFLRRAILLILIPANACHNPFLLAEYFTCHDRSFPTKHCHRWSNLIQLFQRQIQPIRIRLRLFFLWFDFFLRFLFFQHFRIFQSFFRFLVRFFLRLCFHLFFWFLCRFSLRFCLHMVSRRFLRFQFRLCVKQLRLSVLRCLCRRHTDGNIYINRSFFLRKFLQ